MPKIKTHKATAKRVKITRNDKIRARKAGQDHFNARATGQTKRDKRSDIETGIVSKKLLKSLMPY
jgi:large subunit ribosomal protein L35